MIKYYEDVMKVITNIVNDIVIKEEDYNTILKDLGVDSLDTASVLLELEEKYEIDFLEEDVENLNTVNLIVKYINENIKK